MPDSLSRRERLALVRVYLVATPAAHGPGWRDALEAALTTGRVGMVQLREKKVSDDEYRTRAEGVQALCAEHDALFIVNDRCDVAKDVGADGVHVGLSDRPPWQARLYVGADGLVGLSTHDDDEIRKAAAGVPDYAGLGPCFATNTKRLEFTPGGGDLVRSGVAAAGDFPVFPIGGITAENIGLLAAVGARRAAVGAGILEAPDPAEATRRIHAVLAAVP